MEKTKKDMAVIDISNKDVEVIGTYYDRSIEMAMDASDLDKIERFMDLKERAEKNEAKKAYHFAMSEFKKEPILISKDKENSQYKSMYTTIGNLVNSVAPSLGKYGLSHKWDIEQAQDGTIKVTCVATHSLGHSDSVSMFAPADKSGAKNPIQQIKSTRTYLQAATFESLFGLASSDANLNDDGNGHTQTALITESQEADLSAMIEEKKVDLPKFMKHFNISKLSELWATSYPTAVQMVEAKK